MPLCCSLAVHFRMASELARYSRWGNQRLESRMRENRTYGSEGGEGHTLPDPYRASGGNSWVPAFRACESLSKLPEREKISEVLSPAAPSTGEPRRA